ncbi:hypothetical protein HJO_07502 [Hyphomonas johnsonii MHS-2]|uniref:Lipoprotein n=2 Tax=Hyphomonas johnsonii TaxID=81031 RepID=A0A059FQ87_9PROT|nr:hypothetical protein HJO_07502 [Hyphomonas johnsonii MHS-2]
MKFVGGLLLGAVLMVSACTAADTSDDIPAAAPPVATEPAAAPVTAQPEEAPMADDREVKTEMDALDRVNDTCGLDAFKPYLGKKAADIPPELVPDTARIVTPSSQVTMDYVASRVNILTKEDGTVIGLKCG